MALWSIFKGSPASPATMDIPPSATIQIFIPSFNRHESLKSLLSEIDAQAGGRSVHVSIFDDGSEVPVSLEWTDYPNLASLDVARSSNHGKKRYWHLVNRIFQTAKRSNADLFYYLADDVSLVPGFFDRSIAAFNGIKDANKVAINLILDQREGQTCWTNYPPHLAETSDLPVYRCQWIDMVIMFHPRMLKALDHQVEPIAAARWEKRPRLSSGVGDQLSQRLHAQGLSMFQVTDSLILHDEAPSVMNPEERLLTPIVSKTR